MIIGRDTSHLGPSAVRAGNITCSSSVISWLPANSNHQHVVCVNNVEVRTVAPGVYRHTITGTWETQLNETYKTITGKNLPFRIGTEHSISRDSPSKTFESGWTATTAATTTIRTTAGRGTRRIHRLPNSGQRIAWPTTGKCVFCSANDWDRWNWVCVCLLSGDSSRGWSPRWNPVSDMATCVPTTAVWTGHRLRGVRWRQESHGCWLANWRPCLDRYQQAGGSQSTSSNSSDQVPRRPVVGQCSNDYSK